MTLSRRNFLRMALADGVQPVAHNNPALHLLNRITWGARPVDVDRVKAIGYDAFLDEQLDPDSIDDSVMDARLARMPIAMLDRDSLYRLDNDYRVWMVLIESMITRAVHSERQLLERMVEFWSDHFNVSAESVDSAEMLLYQRDTIRKHALGNFSQLLTATAKSPAMLVYLDNYVNYAEHPNENYARELLELHTMGVNGGYSEDDVREVARAFTGWTTHTRTRNGFYFDHYTHDKGRKIVLGHDFLPDRGIEDGLQVLHILARHPATANFLCRKLCMRFVSDNPPAGLIASAASVWQETNGDIRAVLRHILRSDGFKASAGQKYRRPLDFFIGAMRVTGSEWRDFYILEDSLSQLSQIPYNWHPPNGYPDVAGAWVNTGGLLARWNTAMLLTHGALSDNYETGYGWRTDLHTRVNGAETVGNLVDVIAEQVFGASLSRENRQPFLAYVSDGTDPETPLDTRTYAKKMASLFGLMLASPLYQWR